MKSATTGTISGCVVWLLVLAVLGACLVPLALLIGGFTSGSESTMRTVGLFICPRDTDGTVDSYSTTSYSDNGVAAPATAHELHCVDSSGTIVKEAPILFALMWEGIAAAAALIVRAVLASALAAPAGMLATGLLKSRAGRTNDAPQQSWALRFSPWGLRA